MNVFILGKMVFMEFRCGVLIDKGIFCDVVFVKGCKCCLYYKGMWVRGVLVVGYFFLVKYIIMDDSMGRVKWEFVKVGEGLVCLLIGF